MIMPEKSYLTVGDKYLKGYGHSHHNQIHFQKGILDACLIQSHLPEKEEPEKQP
jgi:hypothetical protein